MDKKMYKLLGADGKIYLSEMPGAFGGNGKLKIYGRLDCPSALAAGYRPCGSCLRAQYREYTDNPRAYREKFGL